MTSAGREKHGEKVMSAWTCSVRFRDSTATMRRLSACALWLSLAAGGLEAQAQRSQRTADQCFAAPTLTCLMDQAVATLNEGRYPDPDALLEIGSVLVEAGEIGRAQPMFMRALDSAMMMGWPEMRGAMFLHAAEMTVATLGTREARTVLRHAEATARQMNLGDVRTLAMRAVAVNEIEAGRFEQARDELDEALDVVMHLPRGEIKQSLFTMLVDVIVDELPEKLARPVFERALRLADDVTGGYLEASFRATMASAQARLGEIDSALEMADAIDNAAWRSGARAGIAGALATRGEQDRALAIARELDDRSRSSAIFEIALALVNRGATDEALELVPRIDDDLARSNILANVARAAVEAGDLDRALTVAAGITNRQAHTLLLIDLVYGFTNRDIDDAERRKLTDAVLGARDLARSEPGSSTNLHNLVSAFARLGDVDAALATIDLLDDAEDRASALANLAASLASDGDIDRAMQIATKLESSSGNPYLVGRTLVQIAAAHATKGDVDEALALVDRIENPGLRAEALVRIAVTLEH